MFVTAVHSCKRVLPDCRDGVGVVAFRDFLWHISMFPGEFGQGGGGAAQAVSIGVAVICISVVVVKLLRTLLGGGGTFGESRKGQEGQQHTQRQYHAEQALGTGSHDKNPP